MDTKKKFLSLPENLRAILEKNGITDLYPSQAKAVQEGLLSEKNMVLSMPTASGKTLIAELAMLKTILSKQGKCLYIVPLRALASEKHDDFKKRYSYLDISIGIATGDYDHVDPGLTRYDILIATAEKVDSLLRQKPQWLCRGLACVIVDEIHYIGDPHRGPTLETVITRLISTNPTIKLLGLSATIANADALAGWLNAALVTSTWRPVALKEGVYCQGEIKFSDGTSKQLDLERINDDIAALAIDCVSDKGQTLVFLNTRKSAQAQAHRIAKEMRNFIGQQDRDSFKKISDELDELSPETTKLHKQLKECLESGVVFHHAGLNHEQRKIIEDNFKKNIIKVICATPTLAVGVNLPSRRTIIRGLYRYSSGAGMLPISVMEYKQMSGRAGRPQYDKFGESILFAKNKHEQNELFNNFIFADVEPIRSHLGTESALRAQLLASIATGFITSVQGAFEFMEKTFFSYQDKHYDLSEMIIEIITFLEREEMIKRKDTALLPTAFGTRISRLYIDPISAVLIRDSLRQEEKQFTPLEKATGRADGKYQADNEVNEQGSLTGFTPMTLLYIICSLPDMHTLALNKSDIEKVTPFADKNKEHFNLPLFVNDDFSSHLAKIKTAWMLSSWMSEEKEEIICDLFGIGPGDIHRFVESAEWLLYASIEIAKLFKISHSSVLHNLRTQIRYGIKSELLELVNLRGIGRIRARNLFDKGFKSLNDLKIAPLEKLQKVPTIGKEIAASIKGQTEGS